jgi:hypothetical protein
VLGLGRWGDGAGKAATVGAQGRNSAVGVATFGEEDALLGKKDDGPPLGKKNAQLRKKGFAVVRPAGAAAAVGSWDEAARDTGCGHRGSHSQRH